MIKTILPSLVLVCLIIISSFFLVSKIVEYNTELSTSNYAESASLATDCAFNGVELDECQESMDEEVVVNKASLGQYE